MQVSSVVGVDEVKARRRALVVGISFSVVLVVAALVYREKDLKRIREDRSDLLRSVAALKIRQIHSWRNQLLADARWSGQSPLLRQTVGHLLEGIETKANTRLLEERMALERQTRGYSEIFLLDRLRNVIASSEASPPSLDAETLRTLEQVAASKQATIGSLARGRDGRPHLDTVAPVQDERGEVVALVVLRMDPARDLFPMIQAWPVPSMSAETLLVARDGQDVLFVNELRFRKDAALRFRLPLSRSDLPAAQVALGRRGLWEGRDYRGVPVLASLAEVPDSSWYMVAKIDKSEAFAETRFRTLALFGTCLLLSMLAAVGIVVVQHRRRAQLYQDLLETELAKRATAEEFKATLYSIGDAVITTDRAGRVTRMNGVAEQLTAWDEKEARGRPVSEVFRIVNESTREPAFDPVGQAMRTGNIVGLANHTLLLTRDGGELPIADSAAPIQAPGAGILGVVLVFRDQTKERSHEQHVEHLMGLLRAVRRISQLIAHAQDAQLLIEGVCTLLVEERGYRGAWLVLGKPGSAETAFATAGRCSDDSAQVRSTLANCPSMACLERAQATSQRYLVATPSPACSLCPLHGTCMTDRVFVAELRHAGHEYGWLGISVDTQPDDEEKSLIDEMAADVGFSLHSLAVERERQAIAAELGARSEMLNTVPDGIGLIRVSDAKVAFANPALERLYEVDAGGLVGMSMAELLGSRHADVDWETISATLKAAGTWNGDLSAHRKDGSILYTNCSVSSWVHPIHGAVWISVHHDLTTRRQLELQYRQSQKMEAVGQLAGGVAHDFNNVLAALTLQVSMLETDTREGNYDDIAARLEELHTTTNRAAALTRQLLAFSRRQAMSLSPHDLNVIVEELGRLLSRILGERIELHFEPAKEPLWVVVDRSMIEQVIMNLAVNARDAMKRGGQLSMHCERVTLSADDDRRTTLTRVGQYARLRVQDRGCGMTQEVLEHLFEPFFTTKEPGRGTGLGLATAHNIITQHEGFIDVSSEEGEGSLFSVYLPLRRMAEQRTLQVEQATRLGKGERVLVVEDDSVLRDLAERSLRTCGYVVVSAPTADEALAVWQQHNGEFELLFTDMVMPGSRSGLDLCHELRDFAPTLPVLISSGYSLDLVDELKALPSGVSFIAKPYDLRALAAAVRRALDERSVRGGVPGEAGRR